MREAQHLSQMYSAASLSRHIDTRETALVMAQADGNIRKARNITARLRVYRAALALALRKSKDHHEQQF